MSESSLTIAEPSLPSPARGASPESDDRCVEPGLVSVVVPVLNSAARLDGLLGSLAEQEYDAFEVVVNDDARSVDDAAAIVAAHAAVGTAVSYLQDNQRLGHGRVTAAGRAAGEYLYFVDADIRLTPGVLAECVRKCREGARAVVVTEEQTVHNFWSRCKWLDKRIMRGTEEAESVRFLPAESYWSAGGHHPELMFAEDKEFDLRVRALGGVIARTETVVQHDEGPLTPIRQFRRAYYWAQFRRATQAVSPNAAGTPTQIGWRIAMYGRAWRALSRHPVLAAGLAVLRFCEAAGAMTALAPIPGARRDIDYRK